MNIRRFFAGTLVAGMVFISAPAVFAQDELDVQVKVPGRLNVNEDVILIIEVKDEDGDLIGDYLPSVTFDPAENVSYDIVYDCGDSNYLEDCQADNRGEDGVFESVFLLLDSPVTATVDVFGTTKEVKINATGLVETVTDSDGGIVVKVVPVTIASVQVGPTPSVWLILIPLIALCGVVTFFVVKT